MAKKSLTLAELVVNLTAKSASFNNELARNKRKTRDWAKETRAHVNTTGKAFAALGGAAAAALTVIYKQASQNIDALAKQSDRLGIATEDLGGLRHAAELTGVSQQKLDSSLERMVKRMGEAEMGIGASASMLKQYGLANDEFFNQKPADQFDELADTIAGMNSQQEQAAFAAAVFGREGVALVNTAKLGSEGISELKDEAAELGLTLSRLDAAKVEEANDAMTRAMASFKGFNNSFTVEFAPVVTAVAMMFTEATKNSNGFRDEVIDGLESVTMAFGYVGNSIRGIEITFKTAQVAASMSINGWLEGLNLLQSAFASVYNYFSDDKIDVSNNALAKMAESTRQDTAALKEELHNLAMQELPSQEIENFFNEIREKSNEAAKVVVENNQNMFSGLGGGSDGEESGSIFQHDDYQKHLSGTKTFFADMATLSEHGNKRLAAIGKAAAKINIGISTADAAMKAYSWAAGWGGPAAGAIAASAAVAAGLMRLKQLESGGISGNGGLSGGTTFDQGLPNNALSPPADSSARTTGETVIQQSIEIKALDGASVQELVNNNREIFVQPVLDHVEETGSL